VTPTHTIGGTVSGLVGTGLVLEDNAGDDLSVAASGAFVFKTAVKSAAAYAVTVKTQPTTPSQTCAVASGSGTVAAADVTTVQIACTTDVFAVGGMVSGLIDGSLVLQDNAGDDLVVSQSGAFSFATNVASGAPYAVTISQQPAGQVCSLAGDTGTVGAAAVSSVLVNCTPNTYAIGGTVTGLVGTLVVQNEGGDDLTLTADGTFAFATPIQHGSAYAVTTLTTPTSPNQTCTITNDSGTVGTADVSDVTIVCTTNPYTVSVSVSGVAGAGLVLQNNAGDDLAIAADGDYTFATTVLDGQPYAVTVSVQPTNPDQVCTVTDGSSVIAGADVTGIVVTCE
jgi:hypothetical protein